MATVPLTIRNEDEGGPGLSLLETGDIDTMQAQISIRLPDTSTTLPAACLFSQASGLRSISAPNNATPQNQNNSIYSMDQDERIKALAIGITNDSHCASSALFQGYANIAQDAVPVPLAASAGAGKLAGKLVTAVSIAEDIWNAAGA